MKILSTAAATAALIAFAGVGPAAAQYGSGTSDDIVTTAVKAGSFNTLAQALEAAGLVETLKGEGPFTVFAPTDEAFAKLPDGTLESLLRNPERLRAILTYHVVPGEVTAAQVVKLDRAQTVQGQNLDIRVENGTVRVDDARVIRTDIRASNGVIHVIDSVVLPEERSSEAWE